MSSQQGQIQSRPPVVVIMGHVDHGKSTLLDYIRKSNITAGEAGGITQHMGAYVVSHGGKLVTFLDTPGHEAFSSMRSRGARVADIAILVVAADDGVKAQTVEALKEIQKEEVPFIVAINKIDREGADIDRTKQQLAENGVFVEGYGGSISCVPISAKKGTGIDELLETILLTAEIEELTANPELPAIGLVIESHLDKRKGTVATLIIKDGSIRKGDVIVIDRCVSPIRSMEDFLGKPIDTASPSTPVRLTGLCELPVVGAEFKTFTEKSSAEEYIESLPEISNHASITEESSEEKLIVPVVLKADTAGTLEAIEKEIQKLQQDRIGLRLVVKSVGAITENDIKTVVGAETAPIVIGFNAPIDRSAKDLAERHGINIETFDIIYKLTEWLEETVKTRRPVKTEEVVEGKVKILKTFSQMKDRQVIGGQVFEGTIMVDKECKIMRREEEIGRCKVLGLEQNRQKVSEVASGKQFGAVIESKLTIAEGDRLDVIGLLTS